MQSDVHYYNSPSAYIPTTTAPSPTRVRPPVPLPRSGSQQYPPPAQQHPTDSGQVEAPRGHQYEHLQHAHQYERLQHTASPAPLTQDYLVTSEYLTTAEEPASYSSSGPYEQPPEPPGCGTPRDVASDLPPPQQQSALQQRVVVFSAGHSVTVEHVQQYNKHIIFAFFVFWCANPIFGAIALGLAC